jgi:hypothetical protein
MPASVVVGRRPEPRRPRPMAGRRARDGNWLMHGTTVWFLRNARERRRPDSSWSANPTDPFDINCGGGTARRDPAGRFTSASGRRHRTRNDLVMRACAICGLLTELTAGDERNMSWQVNWGRCEQEVGPIELALHVVGRSKDTESSMVVAARDTMHGLLSCCSRQFVLGPKAKVHQADARGGTMATSVVTAGDHNSSETPLQKDHCTLHRLYSPQLVTGSKQLTGYSRHGRVFAVTAGDLVAVPTSVPSSDAWSSSCLDIMG